MQAHREPLAGRVAGPLRSGALWGMLALVATAILAMLVGAGGSAITWVMERFDAATFGWPGNLVFGAAVVGVALSIPSAAWAVAYASSQHAPAGRALLASGLGIGALIAIATVDRALSLAGGAGMMFAVALPFDPWHRLSARVLPVVVAVVIGAVTIEWTGNGYVIGATALGYPIAAALVWLGDAAWRGIGSLVQRR